MVCRKHFIYITKICSENKSKKLLMYNKLFIGKTWYNHISDFKTYKENGTELPKYIWKLKNINFNFVRLKIIQLIGKA